MNQSEKTYYLGVNRLGMLNGGMWRESISEGGAEQQSLLALGNEGSGHRSARGRSYWKDLQQQVLQLLALAPFHKFSMGLHTSIQYFTPCFTSPSFFLCKNFLPVIR